MFYNLSCECPEVPETDKAVRGLLGRTRVEGELCNYGVEGVFYAVKCINMVQLLLFLIDGMKSYFGMSTWLP